MLVNGVWYENVSCSVCRHRHPKVLTCDEAATVAAAARIQHGVPSEPEPEVEAARVIGLLDRALSESKLLAKSELDAADRQTVKHHAEDCVLLGRHVLKLLGAEEPK